MQNAGREYERMCRIIGKEVTCGLPYAIHFSFKDKDLPQSVDEAWGKFYDWALKVDLVLEEKGKEKMRYVAVLEEAPDGVKRFHFHGVMFLQQPYTDTMKWPYGHEKVEIIGSERYQNNLERYIRKEWGNHDRQDPRCFRTNIFSHFEHKEMEHKLREFTSDNWEDVSLDESFHYDDEMHKKYFDIIFQDVKQICEENGLSEFSLEEYKTWFDSMQKVSSSEDTKKQGESPENT